MGTAYLSGQSPERPGRGETFHGLGANFDSLKAKNIHAGNTALGDCLGRYRVSTRVGIFA